MEFYYFYVLNYCASVGILYPADSIFSMNSTSVTPSFSFVCFVGCGFAP